MDFGLLVCLSVSGVEFGVFGLFSLFSPLLFFCRLTQTLQLCIEAPTPPVLERSELIWRIETVVSQRNDRLLPSWKTESCYRMR